MFIKCNSYILDMVSCRKTYAIKAIGGGPGSFLHVRLILKISLMRSQRFLRNQKILNGFENMVIWIFGPLDLSMLNFVQKSPLKCATFGHKMKTTCIQCMKLHKKLKTSEIYNIYQIWTHQVSKFSNFGQFWSKNGQKRKNAIYSKTR